MLLREIAEKVSVYTFSDRAKLVPPRRGFALRDAMEASQPHGGTHLGAALDASPGQLRPHHRHHRRAVARPCPRATGKGYVINVASSKNGVGYGAWTHIDGWSESVIDYIRELEQSTQH